MLYSHSNQLALRCREAATQLASLYGDFVLFSLIQQEATAGKWDVVVSAPWTSQSRASIQRVVDVLRQHLTAEDWLHTARVLTLEPDSPFVETMTRLFFAPNPGQNEAGSGLAFQETGTFIANDLIVERAIIIVAERAAPAVRITREPVRREVAA